MVRAELGGVEVSQAGGTKHVRDCEPRTEHCRVGQGDRRQRPKGPLHGVRDTG